MWRIVNQTCTSWIFIFTEQPTHVLVHFPVDDTISVIHVKRVIEPPLLQLTKGDDCKVKWSKRKVYNATVLCIGKKFALDPFPRHVYFKIIAYTL